MAEFEPRDHVWTFSARPDVVSGGIRLVVSGRIGAAAAPLFEQALQDSAARARRVSVDFSAVDYISSAGVYAMQRVAAAGTTLVIERVSEPVGVSLRLAGAIAGVEWGEQAG